MHYFLFPKSALHNMHSILPQLQVFRKIKFCFPTTPITFLSSKQDGQQQEVSSELGGWGCKVERGMRRGFTRNQSMNISGSSCYNIYHISTPISFLLLLRQTITNWMSKNNTNGLTYSSGGQKSKMGLTELISGCGQGCSFLESLGENLVSCLSQLPAAACILRLTVPFLHFQSQSSESSLPHCLTLTLPRPLFTHKDSCGYIGPTWTIRDALCFSRQN